jgi:hypothetical protein
MSKKGIIYFKIIIFLLLLFWLGFSLAEKINLTTADLGRHIKNGEWVVNSGFNLHEKNSPLFENFYSYTNPDYPAINHHWGSGVIFFYLHKFFGFSGLSVFYILLSLIIFSLLFLVALGESNFILASILAFFLIPLMAERAEVRPEIFTYLFSAIFFWVLWGWKRELFSGKWLWILPIGMLFWVNTHIYFFLGFFFLGVFLFAELVKRNYSSSKKLGIFFVLTLLASLLNPFWIKGLTYPLSIFRNYGYPIVENHSVSFVENYGLINPNYVLIKAVIILLALSFILLYIANRKKISWSYLLAAVFFSLLGWIMIRNFTLLGYFAFPILAYNLSESLLEGRKETAEMRDNVITVFYIFLLIFAVYSGFQFQKYHWNNKGVGLLRGNNGAAEFVKDNRIQGPIYNNYDIGGYLIFSLPFEEKVYVDNRPETYPDSFFQDTYMRIGAEENVWRQQDEKYNFNAIIFYRRDITPWGQGFLKNIQSDLSWALVYSDSYAIIYLKDNELNQPIIEKFQIK